jgi:amino acid adenylation domain-containing protein
MLKAGISGHAVKLCRQTKCIHRIFEDQVAKTPESVAICTASEVWSYAQLNSFANRAANRLHRGGVRSGSLVGVCLPRSLKTIAVLIGILKAGAAYVPLDIAYPEERLRFMAEDTQASCLISDGPGMEKFAPLLHGSHELIHVDEFDSESSEFSSDANKAGDLAYVMYTSGSTGVPKGVAVEHRGIVRLVCDPGYVSIDSSDVFIQLAPLSFDASTFEIWAPLLNGAKLVVPPPEMNSLADIADSLGRYRVTSLWLTSGLFNAMVDEYPEALRNLKQLLSGGDVLSPSHVRRAMEGIGSGHVINGYGPTENTTFTCCHRIEPQDTSRATIPIGRPIRGTDVYIVDGNMRPVSGQQVGEIYIGGEGLARGYWNRPELTAEKFIQNPFSPDPSSRLYKSGDLGHYNAQGNIEFDGRIDLQVKIRGFRIELPGIESVVNSIPGIANSVVVVKDAHSEVKRLACYFVRQACDGPGASALEQIASDKLPSYMLPSEFVELDQLPLNLNGKVDRQYLSEYRARPEQDSAGEGAFSGFEVVPGRSVALEQQLAAVFSSLFGIASVGLDDDFFHLGGNSLIAARLFARIEKQFGKKLPLATILSAPSVRRLAAVIRDNQSRVSWSSLVPLKTTGSLPPLFLIHAIGGNVVGYQELASCLPPDQPLYALQAQGLDGKCPPASSVPEMAASYIGAIRRVQPQGPYHLGGYSAGGVVAFAIACQLQESGADVGNLVLIDSSIEGPVRNLLPSRPLRAEYSRFSRSVRGNLAYMRRIGVRDFLQEKRRNFGMNARIVGQTMRRSLPPVFRSSRGNSLNVEESFIQALRNYTPGRFRGGAILLRTEDAEFGSPDTTLGWGSVVEGPLSVHVIPGNHDNVLSRPQVEIVVDKIQTGMTRARDSFTSYDSATYEN